MIPYTLRNVRLSDAGSYTCVITDDRGTYTFDDFAGIEAMVVTVYPHLSTPVILGENYIELDAGGMMELQAFVEGGIPPLTHTWLFDNTGSKAIVEVGGDSPILTIDPMEVEDSGLYWIEVADSGTDTKQSATVEVQVNPVIPVAGTGGLLALAGLTALAGAAALRRRKR